LSATGTSNQYQQPATSTRKKSPDAVGALCFLLTA